MGWQERQGESELYLDDAGLVWRDVHGFVARAAKDFYMELLLTS